MFVTNAREEARITESIAQGSLPRVLPEVPGYEIGTFLSRVEEHGGDLYDALARRGEGKVGGAQDEVCFLLVDPSTQGLEAALMGAQLRTVFRAAVRSGQQLGAIERVLQDCLENDLSGLGGANLWIGELRPEENSFAFVTVGDVTVLHYIASEKRIVLRLHWCERYAEPGAGALRHGGDPRGPARGSGAALR